MNDLMAGRREAEERANDLVAQLNAAQANLRLLARSKNIAPAELDDHLLAAEIIEEQDAEANGEQLETAPSGSGTHPQPVLRTTKKKTPTDVSGSNPATKPAAKPTTNPGTKSDRIPKVGQNLKSSEQKWASSMAAAKSKTGSKKTVVPQAKKPRNDREERLRTGHEMAAEFEAQVS